ncbi:MAG: DUF3604 domain-containing protein [Deltaproteobacteria bacterium]|nr:DUF3604 domain-containing protein [Deltaproteobacteria bacterium]MBW2719819.1 DUF3604 domain-containing protein [Deltaproteobacteria bacterium]
MKQLPTAPTSLLVISACGLLAACSPSAGAPAYTTAAAVRAEPTQLFWGDTHLHTSYSPDAYFFGNETADPETAYRYAQGFPVFHPYHKAKIQIGTPLDFLVVADHAEMMGVPLRLFQGDERLTKTASGKRLIKKIEAGKIQDVFFEFIDGISKNQPFDDLNGQDVRRTVWDDMVAITERHNAPGLFTSFIGWEWTSTPKGKNLHRVVFIPQGGDVASKFIPYSSFDSDRPEDLWAWLEETSSRTGATFTAIPHNSNISGGLMFNDVDSEGRPITAEYARTRMKWEPVIEVTQIKGDSETDPILSPTDEFADFAPFKHMIDSESLKSGAEPQPAPGDFARAALGRGLQIEAKVGANPYKFGMIGSTDSHTGMASAEENNFHGKTAFDSTPANEFNTFLGIKGFGADMSAAGLAGVWAEANNRDALFEAFQRKEVYASTGPRIRVRFFGGWSFADDDAAKKNIAQIGYGSGVPMGGDLTQAPEGKAPRFLIYAIKGPRGANLDRVQIVKGWLREDGKTEEKVYNVAWSDDRRLDADGSLTRVGSTVDLTTGRYTNEIGDAQLSVVWQDPDFDPAARAFYYLRVLEIPTPRHTLYDAIALGMDPKETGHPSTIQERAYSSPIWYTP